MMIDIHCHILPNIDDGPISITHSLSMAKIAEREGITTIIATPHHRHPSFEENNGESVKQAVDLLNDRLLEEEINVKILPAQEVRIYGGMIEGIKKGETLPLVAGGSFVLIEFPSSQVPHYTERLFYDMQCQGYIPIIAHPERNKAFIEEPRRLYELVVNGALTQVTAASLIGHFGKNIKRFTEQLIEANQAHFIASDAHNEGERSFRLKKSLCCCRKAFWS